MTATGGGALRRGWHWRCKKQKRQGRGSPRSPCFADAQRACCLSRGAWGCCQSFAEVQDNVGCGQSSSRAMLRSTREQVNHVVRCTGEWGVCACEREGEGKSVDTRKGRRSKWQTVVRSVEVVADDRGTREQARNTGRCARGWGSRSRSL